MAISARDIFLSVRVSDRATRPLRQISGELRRMQGTSAGVASQRRRLEQQQIANVRRQQRLIDNITSATSGQKRQALNDRIVKQRAAEASAARKIERTQAAITGNQIAQQRAARKISDLEAKPAASQAARTRLLAQRRTAESGLTALQRKQNELALAHGRAQENVARQTEVEAGLRNNVKNIEAQITTNLAAQEAARAKISKQLDSEVSMAQMRAGAMAPVPRAATPESRALHLRTRALFQREAVLLEQQRAAEAALANFPRIRAAADAKVLAAENAILKNNEAQIAAQQKIVALQEKIAVTPTGGRARIAMQKDLQAAQLTQQRLIATSGTLQGDYEAAQVAQATVLANNKNLIADEQKLARDTQLWKTELVDAQNALSPVSAEMSRLNAVEQQYLRQENLQKWSQRARMVEHLGHVLTITGLAATVAFAAAGKTAADFTTQATLAATQARPPGAPVRRTGQIAQRLNQVVLKQMQQFPASAADMQKALYDIFSGTNVQNIGKASQLLRIFNKEAVAGGTSLDVMVQAGITLFNNFPREFRNMTAAGNRFFALVRYGRGTAEQFAASLSPIVPIAKQAGQNFDDVAGTLAFLSRQSRDTTQNAQGLARLLLLLARPEVRAGFKRLGLSVTDAHGRIRPLLDIVSELRKRIKLSPVEALTFFKTISQQATGRGTAGTIQAQRVWARLVENVDQYRAVTRNVIRDNNEFQASFAALSRTPGVRWRIFTNQLKALVILIGEQAIPAFAAIGARLQEAVNWFRQLSPHTQHLIGYFGAFAAVGTLVGGVLITVIGGFASLVITLRLLLGNRGIAGLASEAGLASTRLALMLGVVGPLLYILVRYPGILGRVTSALGGTANALRILTAILTATAVARKLGLFTAISMDAGRATVATNVLRASLLRLGAIGAIAIAIELLLDPNFRQRAHNWMHRQARSIEDDFKRAGRGIVEAFTLGQVSAFTDVSRVQTQRYWDGQFREYQRGLDVFRARVRNVAGRTRLAQETAQLTPPTVDPLAQRRLRGRLRALRQQLRTETVFARPQTLRAIARIRTQLQMPRNAQAVINRAVSMQGLKMRIPLDRRTLARDIADIALAGARVIGFRFPTAQEHTTRRAVTRFRNMIQAAQSVGVTRITPNFQRLFDAMIKARKLANQAQAAMQLHPTRENIQRAYAAWNAYQKALANLQANASKDQVAAAQKTANALDSIEKKRVAKQKDNIKTAVDNVSQMYQDLLQQNEQLWGTLFQGPFLTSAAEQAKREWGVMARPRDLLRDLRAQNTQFLRFQRALNTLRRRGAPPQLIQQLQQLGPEALPNILLLTRMQAGQWRQYIRAFQQGQNLVKQQTMRDLRAQLALYRSFGRNVGRQIVLGIRDQSAPMKSELRRLVLEMFPSLRVTARRQPTRAQRQAATTRPRAPATRPQPRPQTRRRTAPVQTHPGRGGAGYVPMSTTTYEDHYHESPITVQHADLGTMLRKLRFEHRNRPRTPRLRR